jgi:RNA polymerase sigma factor (sigma-70 family)
MQYLKSLLLLAMAGDTKAYDKIVACFRDMAYSYAYAILHDFHLAEDATQEAFLQAFYDLPALQEPLAFPGRLRCMVFKQCDRLTRRKKFVSVPLEEVGEIAAYEMDIDQRVEDRERRAMVLDAIASLPSHEREVVLLFHIRDYSQNDIAAFLGVPASTVNSRLQSARKRLKGIVMEMVEKTIKEYQLPETFRVIIKRPSQVKTSAPALAWFRNRWVLVWQDGVRGDPWDYEYRFWLSESRDTKVWSEPRQLDLPVQDQKLAKLCVLDDELIMHTHEYHGGIRVARSRDLQHWSTTPPIPLGGIGRSGIFCHKGMLYVAYPRWNDHLIGDAVDVIASADGHSWQWLTPPLAPRQTGITDAAGLATAKHFYVLWREHSYEKKRTHDVYICRSEDAGNTWAKPVLIPALSTPKGSLMLAICEAANGNLVVGQDVREGDDGIGGSKIWLAQSADRGQTWSGRAVYKPGALIDPALAFAPDGTLILAGSTRQESTTQPWVVHSRLQPI